MFTTESARKAAQTRIAREKAAGTFTDRQRAASRAQSREEKSKAGKAGGRVTIARHGIDRFLLMVQQQREDRLSCLELQVVGMLDQLGAIRGAHYQTNRIVADYVPDFICGQRIVEVDGAYWHEQCPEKDAARDSILVAQGYTVMRVTEEMLKSSTQEVYTILQWLITGVLQ
jgi:very-short-patch-repair endonuclease